MEAENSWRFMMKNESLSRSSESLIFDENSQFISEKIFHPLMHSSSISTGPLPVGNRRRYSPSNSRPGSRVKPQSRGRFRTVNVYNMSNELDSLEHRSNISNISNSTILSTEDAMFVNDVKDAFNQLRHKLKEDQQENANITSFTSKIKPPKGLSRQDDCYKSRGMLNSFIDDIMSLERRQIGSSLKSVAENVSKGTSASLSSGFASEKYGLFDSSALYAETRYIEMKEYEKNSGVNPTRLKAAVVGDLMIKLCSSMGSMARIMEPLIWELLNCIFIDFAAAEASFTADNIYDSLLHTKTYFEGYYELKELNDDMNTELSLLKQGVRMKDIVKKFQTVKLAYHDADLFIRDCCFRLWKVHARKENYARNKARCWGMRHYWRRWKEFKDNKVLREMNKVADIIDFKLNRLIDLNQLIVKPKEAHLLTTLDNILSPNRMRTGSRDAPLPPKTAPSQREKTGVVSPLSRQASMKPGGLKRDHSANKFPSLTKGNERKESTPPMSRGNSSAHGKDSSPPLSRVNSNLHKYHEHAETHISTKRLHQRVEDRVERQKLILKSINQKLRSDIFQTLLPNLRDVVIASDKAAPSNATPVLEDAANSISRLSSQIFLEYSEELCQTPSHWISGISHSNLKDASYLESEINNISPRVDSDDDDDDISISTQCTEVSVTQLTPLMRFELSPNTQFEMNKESVSDLISHIFISQFAHICTNPIGWEMDMRNTPFLQLVKQVILKKFKLRSIANKNFKELLIYCSSTDQIKNTRIRLFYKLCSLSMADNAILAHYDPNIVVFFFQFLLKLFGHNLEAMKSCLSSGEISRDVILEILPSFFPKIEKMKLLSQKAVSDILNLSHPGGRTEPIPSFVVDIDDSLDTIMKYYDVENKSLEELLAMESDILSSGIRTAV